MRCPPLSTVASGSERCSEHRVTWCTVSMGRIQGLSATLVSSHLAGSRNKQFYSPLDGRGLFTWRGPEFCPCSLYKLYPTLGTCLPWRGYWCVSLSSLCLHLSWGRIKYSIQLAQHRCFVAYHFAVVLTFDQWYFVNECSFSVADSFANRSSLMPVLNSRFPKKSRIYLALV